MSPSCVLLRVCKSKIPSYLHGLRTLPETVGKAASWQPHQANRTTWEVPPRGCARMGGRPRTETFADDTSQKLSMFYAL